MEIIGNGVDIIQNSRIKKLLKNPKFLLRVFSKNEIKASKKINSEIIPELTTRLRHTVTSVDGDSSQPLINNFVQNLLARDSMHLRKQIRDVTPDIELIQEIEIGGESVKVNIPMTVGFFWPES